MVKFKVGDLVRFNPEAKKNQYLSEISAKAVVRDRAFAYEKAKGKTLMVESMSENTETLWVRVLGGEYLTQGWDDDRFLLEPTQMNLF